ncbi:immunoglobulin gamma-1 heavy chain-like [Haliaeetus albicilla]|uniref:immunoglobulin gamma-1 heavy chain-like n=1 Tax=Haliaeetus albicilla TaxID=8969 RepID=UPI0037E87132
MLQKPPSFAQRLGNQGGGKGGWHAPPARDALGCGAWLSGCCVPDDEASRVRGGSHCPGPPRFWQQWQLCKGLGPGEELAPPLRCQPLMAAGGSLSPVGLLWLCLAPAALLRLHQPQSILVVEPGASVEIGCKFDEDPETKFALSWYWRSKDGPDLLLDGESGMKGRFSCTYGRNNLTLHIASAQPDDTSLYLCACLHINYWVFGSGTTLLVGDSWRAGSWVRVLAPRGAPQAPPSLVCAVGATTGPVLVSWPGGPRGVLGLGGGTGPLVSPMGMAGGPGGLCEVNFNASRPPVHRSVELHGATGEYRGTPAELVTPGETEAVGMAWPQGGGMVEAVGGLGE